MTRFIEKNNNKSGILNHGKRINYSINSAVITGCPFAKSTK